jgi:DNA-binding NarL/FixJ family response regulator
MSASVRVAIVDDHAIIRHGLRTMLTDAGVTVVGEASSGREAIELARAAQPDVMLLDIRMKGDDGLDALPRILEASPATAVIILTTYSNPTYLARAIQAGATGYLLKEADPDEILNAIQAAAAHHHLINPALLNQVFSLNGPAGEEPAPEPDAGPGAVGRLDEALSEREREVLRLMGQGLSNAAIAEALNLSITTVKTHVTHILRKLDARDRTQAVVLAMRLNLIPRA